jgi:large subunit ribosomal protein L17
VRHQTRKHSFSRSTDARAALIKGLVISLVEHGRIKTTLAKAKELRRHVEKAVTLGKKSNLSTRRLLISRYGSEKTADTLVTDLSKRFSSRPGGYTRILKLGLRPGDKAPMAFIEFVDYTLPETKKGDKETTVKGDAQAVKVARAKNKERNRATKAIRKVRAASRAANRR